MKIWKLVLVAVVLGLCAQVGLAQGGSVLFDNEWIRVSHVKDDPGHARPMHSHKDTVVVALTEHKRRLQPSGGKATEVNLVPLTAAWMANETHAETNSGKTVGELLVVELKQPKGSWKLAPGDADPAKWPDALEAVTAAPGNHKIIFENDRVRVLDVTVWPGEKEKLHMHRNPSLLYLIAEEDFQDLDAGGKVLFDTQNAKDRPKPPYVVWKGPEAPHIILNRSKNAVRLIRFEVK